MLVIPAHEARHQFSFGIADPVRHSKPDLAGIEVFDGLNVARCKREMLQRSPQAGFNLLLGCGEPERNHICIGIIDRKRTLPEKW